MHSYSSSVVMKGKITDSLNPPLTKSPSEVGYWKLNEMPESSGPVTKKVNTVTKNVFKKMLFSFIRFVLLMFVWTQNWYFTSNLWIGNPLWDFKDIKISVKSDGRTYHIKFSDPIHSVLRTYYQSGNYNKQSVKPSSYR